MKYCPLWLLLDISSFCWKYLPRVLLSNIRIFWNSSSVPKMKSRWGCKVIVVMTSHWHSVHARDILLTFRVLSMLCMNQQPYIITRTVMGDNVALWWLWLDGNVLLKLINEVQTKVNACGAYAFHIIWRLENVEKIPNHFNIQFSIFSLSFQHRPKGENEGITIALPDLLKVRFNVLPLAISSRLIYY